MSRTVAQIMKELDKSGGYSVDRKLLQQQLNELPGQAKAQIAALDAKLARANTQILEGARGRGLGFSGIPIAEQAQYAASEYAPAVARVRQSQNEMRRGILGALNSLARDQRTQAQSIFENERNFREQQRQFNEQMKFNREQAARQAAQAAAQASAQDYIARLQQQNSGREAAIQKEVERQRQLIAQLTRQIQNYGPGYSVQSHRGQQIIVPNF